jgi:hypothetical protein
MAALDVDTMKKNSVARETSRSRNTRDLSKR